MGRCRKDFEKWHGFEVCEDMDIQTSVAWENWQKAWSAARETLTEKARENEYGKRATIWLTEGTPDREKYAFSDGHYRGWHDAVAYLTHNVEFSGGAPLHGAASAGTQG